MNEISKIISFSRLHSGNSNIVHGSEWDAAAERVVCGVYAQCKHDAHRQFARSELHSQSQILSVSFFPILKLYVIMLHGLDKNKSG